MTRSQSNQQPSPAGTEPGLGAPTGPARARASDDARSGLDGLFAAGKPRVKMMATSGDLAPAGATYSTPIAAPLPDRGAGIHLFLSILAATISMVFLLLLANKL